VGVDRSNDLLIVQKIDVIIIRMLSAIWNAVLFIKDKITGSNDHQKKQEDVVQLSKLEEEEVLNPFLINSSIESTTTYLLNVSIIESRN
jgi:hypothetical protein